MNSEIKSEIKSEMKSMNSNYLTMALAVFITAFLTLGTVSQATAQEEPTRSFTEVADNLYRVQNNGHYTMVLVTDDGAIITDPINRGFSTWLKGELNERFNAEVKYVLYSHHHWDHASGGAVFEDTAQFVGHENMAHHLVLPAADTALPANAASLDANGNGQLERSEAAEDYADNFDLFDADGNDAINGAEATRGKLSDVRAPEMVYHDGMSVSLGGQTVELIYTGNMTHTDDMSIIRFPAQSTIFVVDWLSPRRVPFGTLGSGNLDGWLNAIRFAEALDYDVAAGGHGVVGTKADVTAIRHYLEEMRDLVAAGMAAGDSLEDMQASILMGNYSDWINHDRWVTLNVQGMYNILSQ
jgi:glyoxylase-like metal-dependent hydrolase (beta-lactamase superfamily II)